MLFLAMGVLIFSSLCYFAEKVFNFHHLSLNFIIYLHVELIFFNFAEKVFNLMLSFSKSFLSPKDEEETGFTSIPASFWYCEILLLQIIVHYNDS